MKELQKLAGFAVTRPTQREHPDRYEVVMLVGDGTYNGIFFPREEIERAAASMTGRPLNLDHSEKIEDVVGVVLAARWDGRALTGTIELDPARPKYALAKAHVDGMLNAGATPNVSVEVYRKIHEEHLAGSVRRVARDLDFAALAIVSVGACDDKSGCGVSGAAVLRKDGAEMEDNKTPPTEATKEKLCAQSVELLALRADRDNLTQKLSTTEQKLAEVTKERDALRDEKERAPVLADLAKYAPDYAHEGKSLEVLREVVSVAKLAADRAEKAVVEKLSAERKPAEGGRKTALAAEADEKSDLAASTRAAMGLPPKA